MAHYDRALIRVIKLEESGLLKQEVITADIKIGLCTPMNVCYYSKNVIVIKRIHDTSYTCDATT